MAPLKPGSVSGYKSHGRERRADSGSPHAGSLGGSAMVRTPFTDVKPLGDPAKSSFISGAIRVYRNRSRAIQVAQEQASKQAEKDHARAQKTAAKQGSTPAGAGAPARIPFPGPAAGTRPRTARTVRPLPQGTLNAARKGVANWSTPAPGQTPGPAPQPASGPLPRPAAQPAPGQASRQAAHQAPPAAPSPPPPGPAYGGAAYNGGGGGLANAIGGGSSPAAARAPSQPQGGSGPTTTKHSHPGNPVFGQHVPGCPRCNELANGAAPRTQPWRARYAQNAAADKRANAQHFAPGGPHARGNCGPVCTFGDS